MKRLQNKGEWGMVTEENQFAKQNIKIIVEWERILRAKTVINV
jgi:hypothetical protein